MATLRLETQDYDLGTITLWVDAQPLNFRSSDEWKLQYLLNELATPYTLAELKKPYERIDKIKTWIGEGNNG